MSDKKNIETLLQEMKEVDLPKGYDDRFYLKLERHENPLRSLFEKLILPANLGWAASLASVLVVAWSVVKIRNEDEPSEVAINDEIDMLQDLDVLEEWNEEENV